jgi:hypothetical protein
MSYEKQKEIYGDGYYDHQMEVGQKFQKHCHLVVEEFAGKPVKTYTTKEEQYNIGENDANIEIKNDNEWKNTGNLYIEVAEKQRERSGAYYPSGIYRNDKSIYYLIGDTSVAWLFLKKDLQRIAETLHQVTIPTSQGLLLKTYKADKICMAKIIFRSSVDYDIINTAKLPI